MSLSLVCAGMVLSYLPWHYAYKYIYHLLIFTGCQKNCYLFVIMIVSKITCINDMYVCVCILCISSKDNLCSSVSLIDQVGLGRCSCSCSDSLSQTENKSVDYVAYVCSIDM